MITEETLRSKTNICLISKNKKVIGEFVDQLLNEFEVEYLSETFGDSDCHLLLAYIRRISITAFDDWTLAELLTTKLEDLYEILLSHAFEGKIECAFPSWEFNVSVDDGNIYTLAELPEVFARAVVHGDGKFLNLLNIEDNNGIKDVMLSIGLTLSHWGDEEESKESEDADDTNEEEVKTYGINLLISYHRDYTSINLIKRIRNRLAYKWPELVARGANVNFNGSRNAYYAYAVIKVKGQDLKEVCDHVFFRLGKTSGKPWKRCKVLSIEEQTN